MFRKLFPLAMAALALAATAAHATAPKAVTVHIANFAFAPAVVTVAPGGVVTWINDDDDAHSIVSDKAAFHSAALDTKDHYSFTFAATGDYAYHCGLHPHMVAKILVRP
jgi:plastocyanin